MPLYFKPSATALGEQRVTHWLYSCVASADVLATWVLYLQHIEQTCPLSEFQDRILACLTKLTADGRYHDDPRFLRLWLQYVWHELRMTDLNQLL
jgi:hypothetical protein